jgi:hypothetical protein
VLANLDERTAVSAAQVEQLLRRPGMNLRKLIKVIEDEP